MKDREKLVLCLRQYQKYHLSWKQLSISSAFQTKLELVQTTISIAKHSVEAWKVGRKKGVFVQIKCRTIRERFPHKIKLYTITHYRGRGMVTSDRQIEFILTFHCKVRFVIEKVRSETVYLKSHFMVKKSKFRANFLSDLSSLEFYGAHSQEIWLLFYRER